MQVADEAVPDDQAQSTYQETRKDVSDCDISLLAPSYATSIPYMELIHCSWHGDKLH